MEDLGNYFKNLMNYYLAAVITVDIQNDFFLLFETVFGLKQNLVDHLKLIPRNFVQNQQIRSQRTNFSDKQRLDMLQK